MPRCINVLCLLLGYSRQAYYQAIKQSVQQAFEEDLVIQEVLRYRKDQKILGTRKLYKEMRSFLLDHNFKIGRDRLFALLGQNKLLIRNRKRGKPSTTFSRHHFRQYPNIIKEFTPTGPNQLWVSDITYIVTVNHFGYLSLITDAYSRKIVGFALKDNLSAKGPIDALCMALDANPDIRNLIHHSDRGVQYCCDLYGSILKEKQIQISMTETGDPLENPIAERVNGILKQELLENVFDSFQQAEHEIAKACEIYNHLRPHSSIDFLKPAEAHQMKGPLPRRWKNYYSLKPKEVDMI